MASSRTMRSTVPVFSSEIRRSMSPNGRLSDSANHRRFSSSSAFFSSPSSSFGAPSSSSSLFQNRSNSPGRVNLQSATTSPSVRFAVGTPTKERHIARRNGDHNHNSGSLQQAHKKRTCMCSPTTHPGSFRCALHKNSGVHQRSVSTSTHRRSEMANLLTRPGTGTLDGSDLMKRVLAAMIRPSSHQQRRRSSFQPRPSRLSTMSS
ncbi:hypothetical protein ZOSMA_10G00350 [Zostera marina]|uniref:Serine-rich protein-like protein n=1 Tax=Zostera marina TaxID=29655 RepID=A0A0K9Q5H9_ZOSMR|nr:hypothetical protein ZOSMA_10G00350 [Zostera marina]